MVRLIELVVMLSDALRDVILRPIPRLECQLNNKGIFLDLLRQTSLDVPARFLLVDEGKEAAVWSEHSSVFVGILFACVPLDHFLFPLLLLYLPEHMSVRTWLPASQLLVPLPQVLFELGEPIVAQADGI